MKPSDEILIDDDTGNHLAELALELCGNNPAAAAGALLSTAKMVLVSCLAVDDAGAILLLAGLLKADLFDIRDALLRKAH